MEHCYCLNYMYIHISHAPSITCFDIEFRGSCHIESRNGGWGHKHTLATDSHPVKWDWVRGLIPFSTLLRGVRYTLLSDTCTWFFFQIMSIPTGPSVAIIGGGVSGLVSAIRLNQLGLSKVTVFDTGKDLQFSVSNLHIIRLFPKVKLISRSVSEAKI